MKHFRPHREIPKEIIELPDGPRLLMFDPPSRRWREHIRVDRPGQRWESTQTWARSLPALKKKIGVE